MAYRPGQGLNSEALERLRARKQQALPAEDDSKQWDSLLGGGAKKKTRCGVCTRPLSNEEQCTNTFICSLCAQASRHVSKGRRQTNHTHKRRRRVSPGVEQTTRTKMSCETPSTRAGSDCQSPRDSEQTIVTADELLVATVTKALCHRWIDDAGGIYTVRYEGGSRWTCVFIDQLKSRRIVSLSMDAETHVVWWGNDHFFDISELCSDADNLNWYNVDDISQQLPDYVWRRHCSNEADTVTSKASMLRLIARGPPPYSARIGTSS